MNKYLIEQTLDRQIQLPQVALICCIFNVIANGFKHATCCCHIPTVKDLQNTVYE